MATDPNSERANYDQADLVYLAKLAEQADRFEEMKDYMTDIVHMVCKKTGDEKKGLTTDERNLLSVAFKNVIGNRRSSWRQIDVGLSKSEGEAEQDGNKEYKNRIEAVGQDYKKRIEDELKKICEEVNALLKQLLVDQEERKKAATSNPDELDTLCEEKVFYLKMQGDYYRYIAEFKKKDEKKECPEANNAREKYMLAKNAAEGKKDDGSEAQGEAKLKSTHPIRLGLALNFSVFYYEVEDNDEKAKEMARKAFDDAMNDMESIPEGQYKDSTLIMQLLRDNLTLWQTETAEDQ